MPAVLAGIDMTAECCRAAVLDRRHDLELGQVQVACLRQMSPWMVAW
jgi:hypothetical protein